MLVNIQTLSSFFPVRTGTNSRDRRRGVSGLEPRRLSRMPHSAYALPDVGARPRRGGRHPAPASHSPRLGGTFGLSESETNRGLLLAPPRAHSPPAGEPRGVQQERSHSRDRSHQPGVHGRCCVVAEEQAVPWEAARHDHTRWDHPHGSGRELEGMDAGRWTVARGCNSMRHRFLLSDFPIAVTVRGVRSIPKLRGELINVIKDHDAFRTFWEWLSRADYWPHSPPLGITLSYMSSFNCISIALSIP